MCFLCPSDPLVLLCGLVGQDAYVCEWLYYCAHDVSVGTPPVARIVLGME